MDYEILFVDDGSRDATLRKVDRSDPRVRVLEFERNAGQSAAMYAGAHAARGRVVALIDGDLQNDPVDILKLFAEVERGAADLVCGYRAKRKDTVVKRITSRVANFVRSRFTRDGVRDTGCTLKAMRRECVDALVPFVGMHRFIPALVKGAGYRLVEVPVNHRARRFRSQQIRAGQPGTARDGGYVWRALAAWTATRIQGQAGQYNRRFNADGRRLSEKGRRMKFWNKESFLPSGSLICVHLR